MDIQNDIQKVLDKDITAAFGVDDMDEIEKEEFFLSLGKLILDSTLLRFQTELSPEQRQAFEQYLEIDPEPVDLLKHLDSHYEMFNQILREEIATFKTEAMQVLGVSQ